MAIKLLLDRGADPFREGLRHSTALEAAISQNHEDIVDLLLPSTGGEISSGASFPQAMLLTNHGFVLAIADKRLYVDQTRDRQRLSLRLTSPNIFLTCIFVHPLSPDIALIGATAALIEIYWPS
jgi:ankyrin repeat protein